jgi:hypothetical protein
MQRLISLGRIWSIPMTSTLHCDGALIAGACSETRL